MFEDTFEENGRVGLRSCEGENLVPAIYDDLLYNSDPSQPLPARRANRWGLVLPDGKGTPITGFDFDNMFFVNRLNLFRVFVDGKKNLLTLEGKLLFPYWASAMEIREELDYMSLTVGNKLGLFFFSEKYFIPAEYDEMRTARGVEDASPDIYIRQGVRVFRVVESEKRLEELKELSAWEALAPDEDICPVDVPVDFC